MGAVKGCFRSPVRGRVGRPGVVVLALGLVLLVGSYLVAADLARTSKDLRGEAVRTEGLILSNVRTLGQAQRELLQLLDLLDTDAAAGPIRRQVAFVSQRVQENALPSQSVTLGSEELSRVTRVNEETWRRVVLPAVRASVQGGPGAVAARARARTGIASLELSYNTLAAAAESNRRQQTDVTNDKASDLAGELERLLWVLGVLVVSGLAMTAAGAAFVAGAERRRRGAVAELRVVNEDLSFYARVVQATDSALVATDNQGRITWVNEAFERRTGWPLSRIGGRLSSELMSGPGTDPVVVEELRAGLRQGRPVRVEIASYAIDGVEIWWSVDVVPLRRSDGGPEGFFAVLTDITDRRAAECLLERARQDAETSARQKTAVLATMSHEIRTPMNAVVGLNDLLLHTELDQEQREYVETARRSGEHLLTLIDDILDYYSLEAGRMSCANEPFVFSELVTATVEMFATSARSKGVELQVRSDPALSGVELMGDAGRLRQVLVNLVGNAVKFTDHGSVTITSTLRPAPGAPTQTGSQDPADEGAGGAKADVVVGERVGERVWEVVTTISDTGIGVPEWRIPELFESFVRGNGGSSVPEHPGTGLGLALSKGLVEMMGGTVTLDSRVGEGTTVTVRTSHVVAGPGGPEVAAAPEDRAPALPGLSDRLASSTVLVVEDDPINRKVITGMLRRLGVVPVVHVNGQEAVEAVTVQHFDVVLMDVEMPVMNGVTAARRIRDHYAESSSTRPWIIALTANALAGDRDRFLTAGMDGYLSKPITLRTLSEALGQVTVPVSSDS